MRRPNANLVPIILAGRCYRAGVGKSRGHSKVVEIYPEMFIQVITHAHAVVLRTKIRIFTIIL